MYFHTFINNITYLSEDKHDYEIRIKVWILNTFTYINERSRILFLTNRIIFKTFHP